MCLRIASKLKAYLQKAIKIKKKVLTVSIKEQSGFFYPGHNNLHEERIRHETATFSEDAVHVKPRDLVDLYSTVIKGNSIEGI